MSTTMTRVRRAAFGLVVATFSIGVVATSTGGASLGAAGSLHTGHVTTACHTWGSK